MSNMVHLSKHSSPRSGINLLFSDEANGFSGSRGVSPGISDIIWEKTSRSEKLQRHLQHVDACLDLTMLDSDDTIHCGADSHHAPSQFKDLAGSNKAFHEAFTLPVDSKVAGIGFGSVKGGQTDIRDMSQRGTRYNFPLVELLRENWSSRARAVHLDSSTRTPRTESEDLFAPITHNSNAKANTHQENMLTSNTLKYHGESQNHLDRRQATEAVVSTRPCSERRSRSRAIAIKRASRDINADEIRETTAAAEYDWATWRMYNRIIDHREKHPTNYQHCDEDGPGGTTSSTSKDGMTASHRSLHRDSSGNLTSARSAYQIQDYPQYGEVFELDL